jgi:hypothetical protein
MKSQFSSKFRRMERMSEIVTMSADDAFSTINLTVSRLYDGIDYNFSTGDVLEIGIRALGSDE